MAIENINKIRHTSISSKTSCSFNETNTQTIMSIVKFKYKKLFSHGTFVKLPSIMKDDETNKFDYRKQRN